LKIKIGGNMKAITIWQPWASLIAVGAKKNETRSWKAPKELIGQRIAIHAAKKLDKDICLTMPFADVLIRQNLIRLFSGGFQNTDFYLSTGEILATCKLTACLRIISEDKRKNIAQLENAYFVSGNEFAFGDYTPGRYAWILEDIQALKEPIFAKGMQRLWNWEGLK